MRHFFILVMCLSLLAAGSTALAEECAEQCQRAGDSIYKSCMESLDNGIAPIGIMTFGKKFIPPEKGYPRQKYCLEYTIHETDDCFEECPPNITLFGPSDPKYTRNDINAPMSESEILDQQFEEECDRTCMTYGYEIIRRNCLKNGGTEDPCFDEGMKAYLDCSKKCQQ